MLASGHPDCFTAYYVILWSEEESTEAKDKVIEELLNRVSDMWLRTNASLFKHVLDYEVKLDAFLDRAGVWIRIQEERIWMMMHRITKDIGAPLYASLAIVFCLLDTLPSFPANLAYQSTSPMITGFVPEVYAQQPWLGLHNLDLAHTLPSDSHRKVEDVLKKAILHSTGGNTATAVSTGLSASTSTVPKQIGQDANELPKEGIHTMSPPVSSVACSPTKCKCTRSPSLHCSWSGSSSYVRGSGSSHGSRRSPLSSSGLGSGSGSGGGSHNRSPAWSKAR